MSINRYGLLWSSSEQVAVWETGAGAAATAAAQWQSEQQLLAEAGTAGGSSAGGGAKEARHGLLQHAADLTELPPLLAFPTAALGRGPLVVAVQRQPDGVRWARDAPNVPPRAGLWPDRLAGCARRCRRCTCGSRGALLVKLAS